MVVTWNIINHAIRAGTCFGIVPERPFVSIESINFTNEIYMAITYLAFGEIYINTVIGFESIAINNILLRIARKEYQPLKGILFNGAEEWNL